MSGLEAILLTVITAATPLLLAAIGELVTERSGVLNLGVEGMMIVGAVAGFGAALLTGSLLLGVIAAMIAGMILAALFGFLTLYLATNQVATGLSLTLLGLGLSGMMGEGFVGQPGLRLGQIHIPVLSYIPFIGPVVFGQDPLVYLSFALTAGVWWFLFRSRGGLVLRAVGDNHVSAHSLGYPVLKVRFLAVLFGGACAGLGGAYLSLVYTPQWVEGMTAGRGWIALALVVFASWLPGRVVAGAYLFGAVLILQFHALSRNRHCAGADLAQPIGDPRQYARLPWPAFRSRPVTKALVWRPRAFPTSVSAGTPDPRVLPDRSGSDLLSPRREA